MFEAKMAKKGYTVSKPTTHKCQYDYIVEIGSELYRVQVKTGTVKRGSLVFQTTRRTTNTVEEQYRPYDNIDVFVVRNKHNDQLYWVPETEVDSKMSKALRIEDTKIDVSETTWAEEYEIESVLEEL